MTARRAFSGARSALIFIGTAALLTAIIAGGIRFYSLLKTTAGAAARNAVTQAVNAAVKDMIGSGEIRCEDIIILEKDSEGNVSALTADMAAAELINAEVSERVREAVAEQGQSIFIPLGTAFGGAILSGRGARIPVKIISVGAVSARMRHGFSDSGINQTLHSLVLCVEAEVNVLVPGRTIAITTRDEICLAETVIVGGVPESYTYFADNGELDSVLDKYDIVN